MTNSNNGGDLDVVTTESITPHKRGIQNSCCTGNMLRPNQLITICEAESHFSPLDCELINKRLLLIKKKHCDPIEDDLTILHSEVIVRLPKGKDPNPHNWGAAPELMNWTLKLSGWLLGSGRPYKSRQGPI